MSRARLIALLTAGLLAMSLTASCGSDSSENNNKAVAMGVVPGWPGDVAAFHLWKHVLEDKGYQVTKKELEVGPIFIGVAKNDLDLYLTASLPLVHADYWKQTKDSIVDLGAWYDQATLALAVPDYLDIDSIDDLKGKADTFDGTITGIEAGAGMTGLVENEVMPTYGLDDYTLKSSSTTAMLAALKKATDAKKPIVVTLWHPHWAYGSFPIKDLTEPKGAFGEPDSFHAIANEDYAKSNQEVTEALKKFQMSDKQLSSLLVALEKDLENPDAVVDAWAKDNQDFVDQMMD